MAGNYPDVPAARMAYDRDGSAGFRLSAADSGTSTVLTSGEMSSINDESLATYMQPSASGSGYGIIFPELRDVTGVAVALHPSGGVASSSWTSPDTTNGIDGTWTSRGARTAHTSVGSLRTAIESVSWLGVKGVRFAGDLLGSREVYGIHLYGNIASGQNPHRLRLWHPTSDIEVSGAYFDWGDIGGGSSADRTFRVKNNSSTQTANTITVSIEALTDATPSVPGQHTFSTPSVPAFTATKALGNLAPGVISEVITMRRTTASTSALSLWWARVLASAATWA